MAGPDLLTLYERKNALAKAGLIFDSSYQYAMYQKSPQLPIVYEPGLYERAESLARAGITGEFALRKPLKSNCPSFTSLPLLFNESPTSKDFLHHQASFSSLDFETRTLAGSDYNQESNPFETYSFEVLEASVASNMNQDITHRYPITKTYREVYYLDSDALLIMIFLSLCLGMLLKDHNVKFERLTGFALNTYWPGALMYASGAGISSGSLMIAMGFFSEFHCTSPSIKSRWRLLLVSSIMTAFSVALGSISVLGFCGAFAMKPLVRCVCVP